MDRGDSWAIVHGITKSQTQLSKHMHVAQKLIILLPPCTISSRVLSSLNLTKHNNVTAINLIFIFPVRMDVLSPSNKWSQEPDPIPSLYSPVAKCRAKHRSGTAYLQTEVMKY